MAALRPVALYGLTVLAGDDPVPALVDDQFPATFRITMAAIDPFAQPAEHGLVNGASTAFSGATLRIIRVRDDESSDEDDEDEDDEDSFDMAQLLDGADSETSEEDEDVNGGPSDPQKSPKARKRADQLLKTLNSEELDEDDDGELLSGGTSDQKLLAKDKGKGRATDMDVDDDDDDDLDSDELEPDAVQEFVVCTLDTTKNYQQPLDITVNEHETVFFKVSGTHDVFLTGNIVIPDVLDPEEMYDPDEEDDEDVFDLPPDEDEIDLLDDEESDELDDLDDPRITEVASDDDKQPPKLVGSKLDQKKGGKKRPAEDSDEELTAKPDLDGVLAKSLKPADGAQDSLNGDQTKLSKSQLKKQRKRMRDNTGSAVEVASSIVTKAGNGEEDLGTKEVLEASKQSPGKPDKKVQFAKTLVQGPSSSASPNSNGTKAEVKPKATQKINEPSAIGNKVANPSSTVRDVQGVTVDDRKSGSGPAAKKGDKVSMRYIGKLQKDGKVFDSNKKGKPFSFKLGAGEAIKGWDIGVSGMSVGSERRITVPAHLAYGSKSLPNIPPNSTLVFDLKLLDIK